VFTSSARPVACGERTPGRLTTERQLKAEVLSAAIEA